MSKGAVVSYMQYLVRTTMLPRGLFVIALALALCGCEREFSDREVFRIEDLMNGKKSGDTDLDLAWYMCTLSELCQRY